MIGKKKNPSPVTVEVDENIISVEEEGQGGITLTLPEPFLQKHLEEYQNHVRAGVNGKDTSVAEYRGIIVKSAIRCGWAKGLTVEGVPDRRPAVINALAGHVARVIDEATTFDPN